METLGSFLKRQREAKNIRLEEIASITKIHLHSLQLLEQGEWSGLPPEPFIRGFIIAYAKYIGIDPKEAVKLYLADRDGETDAAIEPEAHSTHSKSFPDHKQPSPASGEATDPSKVLDRARVNPSRRILISTVSLAVIGAVLGITYIGKRSSEPLPAKTLAYNDESEIPPDNSDASVGKSNAHTENAAPEKIARDDHAKSRDSAPALDLLRSKIEEASPSQRAVASANGTKPDAIGEKNDVPPAPKAQPSTDRDPYANESLDVAKPQAQESEPKKRAHEISVEGSMRTWMKVVIDNQKPKETFLEEGQRVMFKAGEKIKVVLGNSTGAKVVHNGEIEDGEKFSGTIRSYIFPKNARFPQDPPKRQTAKEKTDGEASDEISSQKSKSD
jgi:cytoskeleton protein RodZ